MAPRQKIERHTVEFTGSGGEYFRVWIVNVLLNVVTLGLYTPFARRRKAQYFYSHTFVADSPLEFIGKQRKMVFGFLAFAGLYVAYEIAVRTGQDTASSLLFFGFALLLPWLWGSAMRFRLASTRWRGVRLAFTASWKEVYLASWPVFAIAAVWTAAFILIDPMMGSAAPAAKDAPAFAPKAPELIWPVVAMGAVALVLTLLCVIRLEYNYRRLLVARARIGGQAGRWKPVYGDFVRVWLATVGMFLLCLLAIGLALAAGSALVGRGWGRIEGDHHLGAVEREDRRPDRCRSGGAGGRYRRGADSRAGQPAGARLPRGPHVSAGVEQRRLQPHRPQQDRSAHRCLCMAAGQERPAHAADAGLLPALCRGH